MTTIEFLSHLRKLRVELRAEGDRLRINAPKGVLTPDLKDELAARKAEILAFLQTAKADAETITSSIRPVPRDGHLPLSYSQERLWFLDQVEPGNYAYNMPRATRLKGKLDRSALERTLNEILARHESLRTNFVTVDDEPVQIIAPVQPLPLRLVDLSHLPPAEQTAEVERLILREARQPFDLGRELLVRATLLKLTEEEHIFLLTVHHIVSDGWSMGVLAREFAEIYSAFVADMPNPLPPLPIQYADFAHWQRKWFQEERFTKQLAYWRQQLGGELAGLDLLLDKPRPPVQSFEGGRETLTLSPSLSQALRQLSQAEETTLFMTLLASFKLLLHRYTAQTDIIVGTPVAGRNRAETERLIGFFLNTLVLRTDLSGDVSFRELLGRVRTVAMDAYAHQDIPFEKLVIELQPDRNLSRSPLFQVFFNMLNLGENHIELPGLAMEPIPIPEIGSKFDLTLYLSEQGESINLVLVYNLDLFDPARITEMLAQYSHLLGQIVANPDASMSHYSLVSPAAQRLLPDPSQILEEPNYGVIVDRILEWAQTDPDLPAVSHRGRDWCYGELAEQAQELAKTLVARGVLPGDVVAVTGERSFGLIAAMVGIFLSGGVLLSIDPNLPHKRQEVMLHEAGAKWILTSGDPRSEAQPDWTELGIAQLVVDPLSGRPRHPVQDIDLAQVQLPSIDPQHPAYIFFTSGTTNVPKGVLGIHKGLSHFLHWQRTTFQIAPGDRSAQLTGLSFDVVLRDIFLPLTSGATLYLPDDEHLLGSGRILHWMQEKGITVLHTVPGIVQTWLIDPPVDVALTSLRWIFFAGEPLSGALVQAWRRAFSIEAGIVNLYGPTETSLAKFFYCLPEAVQSGTQPVGWPLPQTQALVLRENNQLCGVGEPGEIVIRTPFRSLGYVNAAQEQQKRFVPNPFRDDPLDLVYYTGDLGRYRADGSLDILGRLDDQVKIRGVRIELNEITAALLEHPLVKSGVAVALKNDQQQYYLAVYAVAAKAANLTAPMLRQFFAERFPAAMIPSAYVFVESLPLTANGKVDRRALPLPTHMDGQGEREIAPPRDHTEARLIEIWKRLLKVDEVGVTDDFFALGGHSMMAVRMFAQIKEEFGVNLPLTALFRDGTVRHLADLIHQENRPATWSSLVEIQPQGKKAPFYCVHGMTGDVVWFYDLVAYLDPEQPLWGLQSRGLDGVQEPFTTIEEMAAHYISEIRALQPEGPYYIGGYSYGGSIAYEMARQLVLQDQQVGLLVVIDHAAPKSGYYTVKLTPFFFMNVMRNLPYRIRDFFRQRPDQILAALMRHVRLLKNVFSRRSLPAGARALEAGALIAQAPQLADHVQRLIETNFRAILNYTPGPYSGRLTLLQARGGRLLCTHDPLMGWGQVVTGGIDVKVIPGSHLQLFREPHIRLLVKQLQDCLNEAQSNQILGSTDDETLDSSNDLPASAQPDLVGLWRPIGQERT